MQTKTEIGHYTVNGQIFDNKFDAVQFAQSTKSTVNWHFFDEVFSKTDWHTEPNISIQELYRIRAQQIRDKYDYVVVFCSGGSDSTNVLKTFLNNKIRIDEIIAIAPLSGLSNWNFDIKNTNEENTISEVKYALMPLLNEIASSHPNIKITINDYFSEMTKLKSEEFMYEGCGNIVTTLTSQFTDVYKFKHIDKLLQAGKKVALVYGTDKPIIRISDTKGLYFVFADSGVNYLNLPNQRKIDNLDRVLFYWSPDLPELLVKQAHVVAKAASLPSNQLLYDSLKVQSRKSVEMSLYDWNMTNENQITKDEILTRYFPQARMQNYTDPLSSKTIYQRLVVPYIYPDTYDVNTFQCQKVNADAGFFTKDQAWLNVLHGSNRVSDMINEGIKSLYNSISPHYLNKYGTGFLTYIKVYKFGQLQ